MFTDEEFKKIISNIKARPVRRLPPAPPPPRIGPLRDPSPEPEPEPRPPPPFNRPSLANIRHRPGSRTYPPNLRWPIPPGRRGRGRPLRSRTLLPCQPIVPPPKQFPLPPLTVAEDSPIPAKPTGHIPPAPGRACTHSSFELYNISCIICDRLCNCRPSYFSTVYPDVLVRSVDGHIVQLSGALVGASCTLEPIVREVIERELSEEKVILLMESNNLNSILGYRPDSSESEDSGFEAASTSGFSGNGTSDSEDWDSPPCRRYKKNDDEPTCKLEDLVQIRTPEKVLVLFDTESTIPTLGITKEILMKVDDYICQHSDDVDVRIINARKKVENFLLTQFGEDPAAGHLETFLHEDWEKEFFNVDTVTFFDIHKANQDLVIWDLYYAIQKWTLLNRGFPLRMVNGDYDLIEDWHRDYMNDDRKNIYGLYDIFYRNPVRYSCHGKNQHFCNEDFFPKHFAPKWWIVPEKEVVGCAR